MLRLLLLLFACTTLLPAQTTIRWEQIRESERQLGLAARFLDQGGLVHNAAAYGAVCDGVANDSEALQKTINAAALSRGVAFLPPGVCKAYGLQINFPLTLAGAGLDQTFILNTSPSSNAITVDLSSYSGIHGAVTVRDLSIIAGALGIMRADVTTGVGICAKGTNKPVLLERVGARNHRVGVLLQDSWNPVLRDFRIHFTYDAGVVVDNPSGGAGSFISAGLISNKDVVGSTSYYSAGLQLLRSPGAHVSNVEVTEYNYGLQVAAATGEQSLYGYYQQVLLDTCRRGLVISGNGTIYSHQFVDVWAAYSSEYGIWLAAPNSSALHFIGGRVRENGLSGILYEEGNDVAFVGTEIASNNRLNTSYDVGVWISQNAGSALFSGVQIGNFSSPLGHQKYGLRIASGNSANYTIVGSRFTNNETAPILDEGTGVRHVVANDAAIYNRTATGLQLSTTSSRPSCTSSLRGMLWHSQGGSGNKDELAVCAKAADDSYAWRILW